MNQKEAVFKALDLVGDKTSLNYLSQKASPYYGYQIGVSACSVARNEWRKIKGLDTDCRTYEGQPERNMTNGLFDVKQAKGLSTFFQKSKPTVRDLKILYSLFSSKNEAMKALERYENYQNEKILFEAA